jgi:ribonuclease HI
MPSENHLGAAVLVPSLKIESLIRLPPEMSVFTAECVALWEALRIAKGVTSDKFIILTDSLSLVQKLSSPLFLYIDDEIILYIKLQLYELVTEGRGVVIAWIPSHRGICYNEAVDALARRASVCGEPRDDLVLPVKDQKRALEQKARELWKIYWDELSQVKGSLYREVQSKLPTKPWYHGLNFNRSQITNISRMRLNHHRLDAHLFRLNLVNSPYCECGLDLEDLDHVFLGCPIRDRFDLYNSLCDKIDNLQRPLKVRHLLTIASPEVYRQILKFIDRNMVIL